MSAALRLLLVAALILVVDLFVGMSILLAMMVGMLPFAPPPVALFVPFPAVVILMLIAGTMIVVEEFRS